jgi:hypothetical protein
LVADGIIRRFVVGKSDGSTCRTPATLEMGTHSVKANLLLQGCIQQRPRELARPRFHRTTWGPRGHVPMACRTKIFFMLPIRKVEVMQRGARPVHLQGIA